MVKKKLFETNLRQSHQQDKRASRIRENQPEVTERVSSWISSQHFQPIPAPFPQLENLSGFFSLQEHQPSSSAAWLSPKQSSFQNIDSAPFSLNLDLPCFSQDLTRSSAARLALWRGSPGPDCSVLAAVTGSPTLVQSHPPGHDLSSPNIPSSSAATGHSTFSASPVNTRFPSSIPLGQDWGEVAYTKRDSSDNSVIENQMLSYASPKNPF